MMLPESIPQSPDFFFRQVGRVKCHVTLQGPNTDAPFIYHVHIFMPLHLYLYEIRSGGRVPCNSFYRLLSHPPPPHPIFKKREVFFFFVA
jgi:hypothetical protein